ncbi:MAG TPA: PDZ domain-containing protein, partial [Gammaproteobacteria bacterium]|nr:PDZ domain-containing protein [Gammaproteobacteria bacterium]
LRAWEMTANGRIRMGDVIEAVDGRPVKNFEELISVLDSHEFGDRITLTVRRDEQRVDVPITLASADAARTR